MYRAIVIQFAPVRIGYGFKQAHIGFGTLSAIEEDITAFKAPGTKKNVSAILIPQVR